MKKMKKTILVAAPILIILFCTFGYLFAPNDPNHVNLAVKLERACKQYPLGTDHMGRCILSRILYGGRTTVGIVLIGSAIVIVVGTFLGLVLGQKGNKQNVVVESILNAVTAIPPIAYLMIFIGAWGNGVLTMLIALTVSLIMRLIKLVKTKTEIEIAKAYIMCAIASGASRGRILFVHIVPNLIKDVIHYICLSCTDMIMAIVGFSFIGIGLGDNVIDWGIMVSESRGVIIMRPDIILYPITFIFLCALSFNLIAGAVKKGGEIRA
ncbi:ABC transporter permease [Tissierella carlieri]|uniref:ABC transporter permease n=1 Tax=Tissierella carlieri TaxID=689904 RepID=A0ABT1S7W2_9FIRM|nr:ABC transporter permease [Tissierella carlieri]MBU5310885.1 ABC transporter permease [Tissierella carlieri]MCQ4922551.1 ABC transporter permease [Tissierella carlieri]